MLVSVTLFHQYSKSKAEGLQIERNRTCRKIAVPLKHEWTVCEANVTWRPCSLQMGTAGYVFVSWTVRPTVVRTSHTSEVNCLATGSVHMSFVCCLPCSDRKSDENTRLITIPTSQFAALPVVYVHREYEDYPSLNFSRF
ncbi:hypothetical protein J6590_070877 [Homalodisca vitripennis]|nr:hypothetical protein J6590_070877 [Homalodisca vitripennis]